MELELTEEFEQRETIRREEDKVLNVLNRLADILSNIKIVGGFMVTIIFFVGFMAVKMYTIDQSLATVADLLKRQASLERIADNHESRLGTVEKVVSDHEGRIRNQEAKR